MSGTHRTPWETDYESGSDDKPPPTIRLDPGLQNPLSRDPSVTPPPSSERRLSNRFPIEQPEHVGQGTMPRVGESFLGFRLVEELGQGAFARVYLAEQSVLANRQVALKVTLRPNSEPDKLARLQHTNIVPVYSVHNAPPVQVICMPYLGRRTIADLIRAARRVSFSRYATGKRTWGTRKVGSTTLGNTAGTLSTRPSTISPHPQIATTADCTTEVLGDVAAVLQLLVRLADGLFHAHERGILHLDLKPANILLADSGEPMLLDFNLSFDTSRANRDVVGGTVTYMAPEQLVDLRSRGKGSVDTRTDLYGLGVVAYELLTGRVPFPVTAVSLSDFDSLIAARRKGPPSLQKHNPNVSPAVEAIIHKLLAPEPHDRYQSARDLKTDLERHLADQPLKFAHEPSTRERFGKWRRRNPRLLGRLVLAAVIGLALGLGGVARNEALGRAAAHAQTVAINQADATTAAIDSLRLDLVSVDDTTYRTRGIERAEKLLGAYGLPQDKDWQQRPTYAALPDDQKPALSATLGEMLLLLAHARWQEGSKLADVDRQLLAFELLNLTRAARSCFATGEVPPMYVRQWNELNVAAGESAVPEEVPQSHTARDYFLDAVFHMSAGRYVNVISSLDEAIRKQPNHGAAHFYVAFCKQQCGEYQRASERYEMVQTLMPKDPRPYFQRGVMLGQQEQPPLAEAEFTRAIQIDDKFALGYLNRAIVRMRQAKYTEAEADLTVALDLGLRPLIVLPLRADVREQLGDHNGANADKIVIQDQKPQTEREFLMRGFIRTRTNPASALEDFRAAEKVNSRSIVGLRNQAHILAVYLNDLDGALAVLTTAIELYPDSVQIRADRAVLLARSGKHAEARVEAERTILRHSKDPQVAYKLSCVYALTSKSNSQDQAKALMYLRQAFKGEYPVLSVGSSDRDLDPIRDTHEFIQLWEAMRKLTK